MKQIGFRNHLATVTALLLMVWSPAGVEAKSYSSSGGGRSYSSSSSRSSSSGHSGSSSGGASRSSSSSGGANRTPSPSRSSSSQSGVKSFTSSGGKSYGSGSTSRESSPKTYTSGKSYSSDSGHMFSSSSDTRRPGLTRPGAARRTDPPPSGLTFDNPAARARKEEASRQDFIRSKEAGVPKPPDTAATRSIGSEKVDPSASSRVKPPPLLPSATGSYGRRGYVPDDATYATRSLRTRTVFAPYAWRPVVVYRDPYNSFFWWWLLDRSLDDRAYWAYHHRYDMDPARYQALVADNQDLRSRVDQLEAQQLPRNSTFVPPGLDRDLMYSDQHVAQAYHNRPTASGTAAFWVVAIPTGLAIGSFLIWLIFFKRWQTAT